MLKKVSSIILSFFVLLGVMCVTPFSVSAETTGAFYGYYVATKIIDSTDVTETGTGSSQYTIAYTYHWNVTVVTNDPTCSGAINIATNNIGSVSYTGTYTSVNLESKGGTTVSGNLVSAMSNLKSTDVKGVISSTNTVQEVVSFDSTQLQNILDAINNVDIDAYDDTQLLAYLSSIESVLNTINTDLVNIAWQLDVNNQYSFAQQVSSALSTMNTRILTISNNLSALSSYIQQVIQPILSNIVSGISTINSRLLTINSTISDGFSHLESNIDSILDTISWKNLDASWQISTDGINWYDSGYVSITSERPYGYLRLTNQYLSTQAIYKMYLNVGTALSGLQTDLILDEGFVNNGVFTATDNSQFIYYSSLVNRYTPKLNLYLANVYDRNANTQRYTLRVSYNGANLRLYIPDSFSVLYQDDIEYWQLLDSITLQQWFNLYQKDNSGTFDNLVSGNESLTNTFESYHSTESSIVSGASNNINSMQQQLSNYGGINSWGNTARESMELVTHLFNRCVNNTPIGSLLTFSLFVGLALLVIGKRGGHV